MSDGPHRSLPMRSGWKKFAERADLPSFSFEDLADSAAPALDGDWREDRCDEAVTGLREILGAGPQAVLFAAEAVTQLEEVRRQLAVGTLRRLLIDHVQLALLDGASSVDALRIGIENALRERAARARFQVQEHYLLKTKDRMRASNVGKRLEKALASCSFDTLARHYAGEVRIDAIRAKKSDDIDDGVRLP